MLCTMWYILRQILYNALYYGRYYKQARTFYFHLQIACLKCLLFCFNIWKIVFRWNTNRCHSVLDNQINCKTGFHLNQLKNTTVWLILALLMSQQLVNFLVLDHTHKFARARVCVSVCGVLHEALKLCSLRCRVVFFHIF